MLLKTKTKKNIRNVSFILFILSLLIYFMYRDVSWVPLILPETIGLTLLFLVFSIVLKTKTSYRDSLIIFTTMSALSIFGFMYGRANDIRFLVDITPEILGVTIIGLVLTIVFGKRTVI